MVGTWTKQPHSLFSIENDESNIVVFYSNVVCVCYIDSTIYDTIGFVSGYRFD